MIDVDGGNVTVYGTREVVPGSCTVLVMMLVEAGN